MSDYDSDDASSPALPPPAHHLLTPSLRTPRLLPHQELRRMLGSDRLGNLENYRQMRAAMNQVGAPGRLPTFRELEAAYRPEYATRVQGIPPPGYTAPQVITNDGRARNRKPITTVVSVLRETSYKEADETKDKDRTRAYISVQRQLLKWLGKNAADTLTPAQAASWTESISPTKTPTAMDALRLCYYMRSQTFDTYAILKHGYMTLYVADQNQYRGSRVRGNDRVYWKQDFETNFIDSGPSSTRSHGRAGRRNALAPPPPAGGYGSTYRYQTSNQLAQGSDALAALDVYAARHRANVGAGAENEPPASAGGPDASNESAGPSPEATTDVLLRAAEARLEMLLSAPVPDPGGVEATLLVIEEIRARLHPVGIPREG